MGCAAAPARTNPEPATEAPDAAAMTRTRPILIVDDNPADRRLILETLSDLPMEYAAREIATGDAAVRFARDLGQNPAIPVPDLLIVDLNLPCVTGIDVLRAFRANPVSAAIPALVLSGSASPADRAAVEGIPGARFAEKPDDMDAMTTVAATIRAMLGEAAAA